MQLLPQAITVAMLGAIESLFSAGVSDKLSNDKHSPNVELIAQGVANIFSPLFGGLPATRAIARTATNVRSGARTPIAGMIHALTLLGVILFATALVKNLPLAALAGILFHSCLHHGGLGGDSRNSETLENGYRRVARHAKPRGLRRLTVAVEVGMILAAFSFIRKISMTTTVAEVTEDYIADGRAHILQDKDIPSYAAVYRVHGPFLFGVTDKIALITEKIDRLPPVVIVRLRNMTAIDATGIAALEELADRLKQSGRSMLVCGARPQPAALLAEAGFADHVSPENICDNITVALDRAREIHEGAQIQHA